MLKCRVENAELRCRVEQTYEKAIPKADIYAVGMGKINSKVCHTKSPWYCVERKPHNINVKKGHGLWPKDVKITGCIGICAYTQYHVKETHLSTRLKFLKLVWAVICPFTITPVFSIRLNFTSFLNEAKG